MKSREEQIAEMMLRNTLHPSVGDLGDKPGPSVLCEEDRNTPCVHLRVDTAKGDAQNLGCVEESVLGTGRRYPHLLDSGGRGTVTDLLESQKQGCHKVILAKLKDPKEIIAGIGHQFLQMLHRARHIFQ